MTDPAEDRQYFGQGQPQPPALPPAVRPYPPSVYPPSGASSQAPDVPYAPNLPVPSQPYAHPGFGPVSGGPYSGVNAPPPASPYPYGVMPAPGSAPFGFDPLTGRPYSDKSKVVAGILQLFLGGFAAGRFYTGHIGLAFGQLAAVWVPALALCCAGTLLSLIGGFVLWIAMPLGTLWPIIDGIVLLVRGGTDAKGQILRS